MRKVRSLGSLPNRAFSSSTSKFPKRDVGTFDADALERVPDVIGDVSRLVRVDLAEVHLALAPAHDPFVVEDAMPPSDAGEDAAYGGLDGALVRVEVRHVGLALDRLDDVDAVQPYVAHVVADPLAGGSSHHEPQAERLGLERQHVSAQLALDDERVFGRAFIGIGQAGLLRRLLADEVTVAIADEGADRSAVGGDEHLRSEPRAGRARAVGTDQPKPLRGSQELGGRPADRGHSAECPVAHAATGVPPGRATSDIRRWRSSDRPGRCFTDQMQKKSEHFRLSSPMLSV